MDDTIDVLRDLGEPYANGDPSTQPAFTGERLDDRKRVGEGSTGRRGRVRRAESRN